MTVEFGEIINVKRMEKGLTQEELAENLYVTRQTVSRWERGHTYPTIDTLVKLSQVLDFSLDYALLGDEEMVDKVSRDQKNALRNKRILSVLFVFLILSICWGIANYFQLNYRTVPAKQVQNVEVVGDKVLVTVDDPNFWSSRSAMIDQDESGQLNLEVNQQFRFSNIFKDEVQIFVIEYETDALKKANAIKLKGSRKTFSIRE
ncbi:helix-turn-helix domain-containing protein [Enterococcus sp. AZ007]|uniref:helix-turn-helix domain-containing protein n=1 Tax=Enterococcus sp. AZ007 TaxID=2774839 RepID=UPI003F22F682